MPGPALLPAKIKPRAINQTQSSSHSPAARSLEHCFSLSLSLGGCSKSCHYQEVISRQIDAGGFICVNTSTVNLIAGRVGVRLVSPPAPPLPPDRI